MRNVIIIGPPAAGKLTIAKALAKTNGYFLFDNHCSIDAVETVVAGQEIRPKGQHFPLRKWCRQHWRESNTTCMVGSPVRNHNAETKPVVHFICATRGYACPEICTPEELMREENED